jgi:hypothetical protein
MRQVIIKAHPHRGGYTELVMTAWGDIRHAFYHDEETYRYYQMGYRGPPPKDPYAYWRGESISGDEQLMDRLLALVAAIPDDQPYDWTVWSAILATIFAERKRAKVEAEIANSTTKRQWIAFDGSHDAPWSNENGIVIVDARDVGEARWLFREGHGLPEDATIEELTFEKDGSVTMQEPE